VGTDTVATPTPDVSNAADGVLSPPDLSPAYGDTGKLVAPAPATNPAPEDHPLMGRVHDFLHMRSDEYDKKYAADDKAVQDKINKVAGAVIPFYKEALAAQPAADKAVDSTKIGRQVKQFVSDQLAHPEQLAMGSEFGGEESAAEGAIKSAREIPGAIKEVGGEIANMLAHPTHGPVPDEGNPEAGFAKVSGKKAAKSAAIPEVRQNAPVGYINPEGGFEDFNQKKITPVKKSLQGPKVSDETAFESTHEDFAANRNTDAQSLLDDGWVRKAGPGSYQVGELNPKTTAAIEKDIILDSHEIKNPTGRGLKLPREHSDVVIDTNNGTHVIPIDDFIDKHNGSLDRALKPKADFSSVSGKKISEPAAEVSHTGDANSINEVKLKQNGEDIAALHFTHDGDVASVNDTWVDAGARGKGNGQRLITEAAAKAKANGAKEFTSDANGETSPDAQQAWDSLVRKGQAEETGYGDGEPKYRINLQPESEPADFSSVGGKPVESPKADIPEVSPNADLQASARVHPDQAEAKKSDLNVRDFPALPADEQRIQEKEAGINPNNELPVPPRYQKYFDAGATWGSIRGHEAGHALVAAASGFSPLRVESHLHPTNTGALASLVIDYGQGSDPIGGKIGGKPGNQAMDIDEVAPRINDILATLMGGGVAQEEFYGIPFDTNGGVGGDLAQARRFMDAVGIPKEMQDGYIQRAKNAAKDILTHPAVKGIVDKYTSAREEGTPDGFQMTEDSVKGMLKEVREAKHGIQTENNPAGHGEAANGVGKNSDTRGKGESAGGNVQAPSSEINTNETDWHQKREAMLKGISPLSKPKS